MKGIYRAGNTANFSFRYVNAEGQRVAVSLKTSDEAEAIRAAQAILGAGIVRPEKTSLETAIDLYLKAAQSRNRKPMRAATAAGVRGNLDRFRRGMNLSYPVDVNRKSLEAWLSQHRRANRSADTLFTYARDICAFSKWLAGAGHIQFDSLATYERPQMGKHGRRNWIRKPDISRAIEAATDPDLKFILCAGFYLGMRKSEILAARVGWFEVDTLKPVAHIQNELSSGFMLKDGDNRTVPINDQAAAFLRVYLADKLPTNYALRSKQQKGLAKYRYDFRKTLETHFAKLGLQCTTHDMRRSFASNLVSAGVPIYSVAKWLGDGLEVVSRSYGHLESYSAEINRLIA